MFDRVLNTPLTLPNNHQVIYKYQIIYSELAGQHIRYMGWRGASRTLNIEDGAFCENSKRLNVLEYFCKKLHLRCLTGSEYNSGRNMEIQGSLLAFYHIEFTKYHIILYFMLTIFANCLIQSYLLNKYLTKSFHFLGSEYKDPCLHITKFSPKYHLCLYFMYLK